MNLFRHVFSKKKNKKSSQRLSLLHYFIPHQRNNHRAKLLHNATLATLIVFIFFASSFAVLIHKTYPSVLGVSYQISADELLNLTNYERAQNSQPPLSFNKELATAAQKKAEHMFANNYWAHFAPDGTSPWDFIRGAGYDYTYAGENLARGFTTSTDAVAAWMKSPTHRANIVSNKFKEVGFAIQEGKLQGEDTVLIVQEFGSRENSPTPIDDNITQQAVNSAQSAREVNGSAGGEILHSKNQPTIFKAPTFDIVVWTKVITFILLSMLLIALVLDFIIIEKKRIPRTVGNNLDHVILITIFIAFLLMAKLGNVI